MMLPHGPDKNAFEGASNADLQAQKLDNTMSFMFETRFPQHLTAYAAKEAPFRTITLIVGLISKRNLMAPRNQVIHADPAKKEIHHETINKLGRLRK